MNNDLEAFLSTLEAEQRYSQNTIAAYRNDLRQFFQFVVAQSSQIESWNQVDQAVVISYVTDLKEKAYASSSIARKVAAVKSFFGFLHAKQLINDNPAKEVESPKVKKRKPQTLTPDEVERLLHSPRTKQTPKNLRDAALLGVLYATGMRVTEVVSLQLNEVDLENRMLHCATGDGVQRDLPIDVATYDLLSKYIERGRPSLAKNGEQAALFLNHRGQQLTRQGLWLIIKAYAKDAKLSTQVTPHTLRHSFAAHKLHNGSNLQEIQQLLGHANISTTQIYTQLKGEAVE